MEEILGDLHFPEDHAAWLASVRHAGICSVLPTSSLLQLQPNWLDFEHVSTESTLKIIQSPFLPTPQSRSLLTPFIYSQSPSKRSLIPLILSTPSFYEEEIMTHERVSLPQHDKAKEKWTWESNPSLLPSCQSSFHKAAPCTHHPPSARRLIRLSWTFRAPAQTHSFVTKLSPRSGLRLWRWTWRGAGGRQAGGEEDQAGLLRGGWRGVGWRREPT